MWPWCDHVRSSPSTSKTHVTMEAGEYMSMLQKICWNSKATRMPSFCLHSMSYKGLKLTFIINRIIFNLLYMCDGSWCRCQTENSLPLIKITLHTQKYYKHDRCPSVVYLLLCSVKKNITMHQLFSACHKYVFLQINLSLFSQLCILPFKIYGAKSRSAKCQLCRLILVLLSILIAKVFLFYQSEWSANDQQQFTHITIPHQGAKSANRKYATHMLGIVTINLYILLKYISPSIN